MLVNIYILNIYRKTEFRYSKFSLNISNDLYFKYLQSKGLEIAFSLRIHA